MLRVAREEGVRRAGDGAAAELTGHQPPPRPGPTTGHPKQDVEKQVNLALDRSDTEKIVSEQIKKFFDSKYGPNWHCVVGKHFASYVTYTSKHYIFFYMGQMAILLYKL